jgi:hypothetical protein
VVEIMGRVTMRRFDWIGLAAAAVLLQGFQVLMAVYPPPIALDFFQEWSSAHEVLAGRPAYPDLEEAVPRLLGVPFATHSQPVRVNAHPPPAILLGLPLASFSYPVATEVWRGFSFGLILACTVVIRRELGPLPSSVPTPPLPVTAVLLLTSGPVVTTIFYGQLNAVLLVLIVSAWWAERHGHQQLGGGLLGLAGAIKLTPMLLLGYFAVRGRWRAVLAGLLAFLAVNALTLVTLGSDVFRDYAAVVPRVAHSWRSHPGNAAFPGLWAKLFDPASVRPLTPLLQSPGVDKVGTLASVVAVATLAGIGIRRARSRSEQDRAFGLAVTALLLAGPLTWENTLLLLLLPLTLLARDWPAWGRLRRSLFLIAVAAVWLMPYTIESAVTIFLGAGWATNAQAPVGPWVTLTILSYQCYALLILFALGFPSRGPQSASAVPEQAVADTGRARVETR